MTKKPTIPAPIPGADALLNRLRPALAADLSIRQTALLLRVAAHPAEPVVFRGLGSIAGIPNGPSITRACDALVAGKLLNRWTDPEDRRRVVLALTSAGVKLAERMVGAV